MSRPQLFSHQLEGVDFLAQRQRAFLAHDPGLGKTATAIVAADRIMAMRILVIVPAVARINWGREFRQWQTLGRKITVALTVEQVAAGLKEPGVLIVSYDAARLAAEALAAHSWDLLILDEAHLLKNPSAKRTRAVYGQRCLSETGSIVAAAKRVWCLSGSPILAGLHEFWPHASALWTHGGPGWPLTYNQWMDRYTDGFASMYGWRVTGSRNTAELKAATEEFILRRRADDVMPQLPLLLVGTAAVPITGIAMERLNELMREVPELLGFLAAADDDAALRVNEHVARARRLLALSKVPGTVELLTEELRSTGVDKIILFGHHREALQRLHKALEGNGFWPVLVQGGMTPALVQSAVDRFQNDSSCRVFVGNIQAAGTAITLTAAHHVRFLEADWTPELNRQAMMRARRIGQQRSVFATFLVADHPLDEALAATLARKTRLIRDFETEGANP